MPNNKEELAKAAPTLSQMGYTLDDRQPHISGERALTGPIGGGHKLLLLGKDAGGRRVVIKISRDPKAIAEMKHERVCRDLLEQIRFASEVFNTPKELMFGKRGSYTVLVTEFIEQDAAFLERPVEEQFALALSAFRAQEGAHAATYEHARAVKSTFGEMRAQDYLAKLREYARETPGLERALAFAEDNAGALEQYCGFLTHWDFMPQNIRVHGGRIYLLDHSSLRFGSKYEGWARFVNFMELYNPPLARALVQYVKDNRTPEESLALKVMRAYRLAELIRYYAGWLPRTADNLHALAQARIAFWKNVLDAVLDGKEPSPELVGEYVKTRDALRSEEEKERQKGLH
jgi:hypothetical protein